MYDNCTYDDARAVWNIFDSLADRIRKADCPAGRDSVNIDYVNIDYGGRFAIYFIDDGYDTHEYYSNTSDLADQLDGLVERGDLTIVQAVLIKAHAAGMRDYLELNARF